MDQPPESVTHLLKAFSAGTEGAESLLISRVYDELRRIARARMARENPGVSLQATELVHEAYLRLRDHDPVWKDRSHFFAVAAEAMKNILIDRSRKRRALKRGGGQRPAQLKDWDVITGSPSVDIEPLSFAIEKFGGIDPRAGQVVKFRYFIGLTIPETAEILGVSERTVRADWTVAKAWLRNQLQLNSFEDENEG